jgi:hypothetical protein
MVNVIKKVEFTVKRNIGYRCFIVALLLNCYCENVYDTQLFYFPVGCKLDDNWEYLGTVTAWGNRKENREQQIDVIVIDRTDKKMLQDKVTLIGKSIDSKISWTEFDRIKISFFEQGDMDTLIWRYKIENRKFLKEVNYYFDDSKKKFKRMN